MGDFPLRIQLKLSRSPFVGFSRLMGEVSCTVHDAGDRNCIRVSVDCVENDVVLYRNETDSLAVPWLFLVQRISFRHGLKSSDCFKNPVCCVSCHIRSQKIKSDVVINIMKIGQGFKPFFFQAVHTACSKADIANVYASSSVCVLS